MLRTETSQAVVGASLRGRPKLYIKIRLKEICDLAFKANNERGYTDNRNLSVDTVVIDRERTIKP
jgi:hypothetical protein